ncbi:MAG: phage tail protein [Micromonosporaceae bacterium]
MEFTRRDVLRTGIALTAGGLLPLTSPFAGAALASSEPYLGEIMIFAGNFAPSGWALCNGQLMPIAENDALFQLIGTTYGGDGEQNFALPNLQSRLPMHQGTGPGLSNRIIGEMAGTESVTLTVNQIPAHTHLARCSNEAGNQSAPGNGVWAASATAHAYANPGAPLSPMEGSTLAPAGGSQPHDNMMPFLVMTFCIALFGIFPFPN